MREKDTVMRQPPKAYECFTCKHKRNIPYNTHISCAKPDPEMTGKPRGIKSGWFYYPHNFDPIWKGKLCSNYEEKE